jgi:hypothetical protein
VRRPLDETQFLELFDQFLLTAFRLETRDRYREPGEEEPLRRFLSGEPPDDRWFMDWYETVEGWTRAGRQISRVRIVTEPLSDYARWEFDLTRLNTAAGEDIRYLTRAQARELSLPDEDFWLFDSREAAILRFGDDDVRLGIELTVDPVEINERCQWRDVAWRHAVPAREYVPS